MAMSKKKGEQRGENSKAMEWKKQAEQLKNQFNQDFWMEDLEFIALALTDDNQHVDSITSNPGHCLSLGILDNDKSPSRKVNPSTAAKLSVAGTDLS